MHTQNITRIFILVVFVLLVLSPTGKAFAAAAPVVEIVHWETDYMLEEQPCPGMEVWDHEVIDWRQTTFFNNDGSINAIKIHIFNGIDNFYTPTRPNFILSGEFGGNSEVDLQTGNLINVSGITAHLTVPGYGRVLMFTGHWLVYPTVHLGGLYTIDNSKDMAKFCSLLSGG